MSTESQTVFPGMYPRAVPASPEYAYVDPKTACYPHARLPEKYHPLDAWKLMGKEPPSFSRWVFHIGFGFVIGMSGPSYINHMMKRPWYSSFYTHLLFTTFTVGCAQGFYIYAMASAARRDALIQHYLETHYDDFPIVGEFKIEEEKTIVSSIANHAFLISLMQRGERSKTLSDPGSRSDSRSSCSEHRHKQQRH